MLQGEVVVRPHARFKPLKPINTQANTPVLNLDLISKAVAAMSGWSYSVGNSCCVCVLLGVYSHLMVCLIYQSSWTFKCVGATYLQYIHHLWCGVQLRFTNSGVQ